ncbi:MAG: hypothetical protein GWP06_19185 [Actinobacteria bacterium]|nr:hypothetical protein [Actinomycetota bacterium]
MLLLTGYFFVTFIAALVLTPIVRNIAAKWHILAYENHRTVHQGQIPKLGGASIFIALAIGVALVWTHGAYSFAGFGLQLAALMLGTFVLFIMGALDDKFDLNCNLKIIIELLAATAAVAAGWKIQVLVLPSAFEINLGVLAYPVSVLWIAGVANAINMIDGLDGLAGGVIIVISLISAAVAALLGNTQLVTLSILIAGAVAGFLRYNLNPASIFMGDSGSLPLGFILACITVNASAIAPGKIAVVVPLLLLGIPVTDTFLAIIRRLRRGIHPFHADQEHIHHRLVNLGLSQTGAAMFIVGMTFILGTLAFLVAQGINTDVRLFGMM